MINLILCGGSGTRLWPLSRTAMPKQFVRLFEGQSLFQATYLRNAPLCSDFLIVSNVEQYFLAVDQLSELTSHQPRYLLEPVGRNTAPAIALACLAVDADDVVLVTTSDHLIKDQQVYAQAVARAKVLAQEGFLVTFGIQPSYAETGFGYIQADGERVLSFKEKPSREVAESYVAQGNYFWNSGMFCFKAGVFLQELQAHAPEIYKAAQDAVAGLEHQGEIRIAMNLMVAIPEESIDYAVMEKSQKVKVVACDMGWSDLGSFDALYDEVKTNQDANGVLAQLNHSPAPICVDAANNLVVSRDRQIALVDVQDLLVVDTDDALLITQKGSSQKVKQVVAALKQVNPQLAEIHPLAHRPWGTYEVLIEAEKYKVKRIVVKPGSKLSLQKHFHRNEHWIVVSGTATVTVDEKVFLLRPNESTYIQMGQVHRLENLGKIDLVMVEVQVGEYTGEDDIVRIEDIYHRVN